MVSRLKKEQSYTSTPPLGLHALFQGELYLYRFTGEVSFWTSFWSTAFIVGTYTKRKSCKNIVAKLQVGFQVFQFWKSTKHQLAWGEKIRKAPLLEKNRERRRRSIKRYCRASERTSKKLFVAWVRFCNWFCAAMYRNTVYRLLTNRQTNKMPVHAIKVGVKSDLSATNQSDSSSLRI